MKEPKEEAEEIFEMFRRIFCLDIDDVQINLINLKYIKQCAILHVEGIIENSFSDNAVKGIEERFLLDDKFKSSYWQEVLKIIKDK